MRACFMGQNVFALGFGVATLQSPPLVMDKPTCEFEPETGLCIQQEDDIVGAGPEADLSGLYTVTNSPRL